MVYGASFDHVVVFNKMCMVIVGLWPYDQYGSGWKQSLILGVELLALIPTVTQIVRTTDYEERMQQFVLVVPVSMAILRFVYSMTRIKQFRSILDRVRADWDEFQYLSEEKKKIMKDYGRKTRGMNAFTLVWAMLSIIAYILSPITSGPTNGLPANSTERRLPTNGVYPFDSGKSPAYEIVYIMQTIFVYVFAISSFSSDCFISIAVFHACGQLALVSSMLRKYNGNVRHVWTKVTDYNCACLKCIVNRHVSVIEYGYMDMVDETFNIPMLLQLGGNALSLAIEGYLMIMSANNVDIYGFFAYMIYAITITYTLFIYCYLGQRLIDESEEVGQAAYEIQWNDLPRNLALPLILLMARAKTPCTITAGKFVSFSLSYYKTVLKMCLSYVSVLRALK